MTVRPHILVIGPKQERERVARLLSANGIDAEIVVATGRRDIDIRLADQTPWSLLIARHRSIARHGLLHTLGERAEQCGASLILLRGNGDNIGYKTAFDEGACDLVDQKDDAHLLAVIRRELKTTLMHRELRRLRTASVEGRAQPAADDKVRTAAPMDSAAMLAEVRQAIKADAIVLHFQPILSLTGRNGSTQCFEVLARLERQDGQLIFPGTFIPLAEKAGLMPVLDRLIMERSVRLLESLQKTRDTRFFINFSDQSLADSAILAAVLGQVSASRIKPGSIVLEVQKSTILRLPEHGKRITEQLAKLDMKLLLEAYDEIDCRSPEIDQIPADFVKLGLFMLDGISDPDKRSRVQAVVDCARTKNIQVIAHAVEHADALPFLYALGVDYIQGNFIALPDHSTEYPEISTVEAHETGYLGSR